MMMTKSYWNDREDNDHHNDDSQTIYNDNYHAQCVKKTKVSLINVNAIEMIDTSGNKEYKYHSEGC